MQSEEGHFVCPACRKTIAIADGQWHDLRDQVFIHVRSCLAEIGLPEMVLLIIANGVTDGLNATPGRGVVDSPKPEELGPTLSPAGVERRIKRRRSSQRQT